MTISSRRVSSRNNSHRPWPRSCPIAATMTPHVSDVAIAASRLTDRDSTPFPPRRRSDQSGYVAAPALRGRLGPLSCPRRLEVVAAGTDSASRCTHDRQHQTDEEHDDADGPEDRNLEQESGEEQDDSKDDHGCEAFLSARLPAKEPDRSSGCSTLISVKYPQGRVPMQKVRTLRATTYGKASPIDQPVAQPGVSSMGSSGRPARASCLVKGGFESP